VARRPRSGGRLSLFFYGLRSLARGLGVTLKYLCHPSTVVTQQYPENRDSLKLADRVRAQLAFTFDENGYHKCTACRICEQQCPNASIHVADRKGAATGKPELDAFIWRLDSCTFCNVCVMVCPYQVLRMNSTFESSVYEQKLLIYNLTPYAGPAASALLKVADPEERKKMIEPRSPYDGPTALNNFYMAGICQKALAAPAAPGEPAGARQ
jgi:NADH-quinone oxidoreductase subunit I